MEAGFIKTVVVPQGYPAIYVLQKLDNFYVPAVYR
jgi:hypothetical protein